MRIKVSGRRKDLERRDLERRDLEKRDLERRDLEKRDLERRDLEKRQIRDQLHPADGKEIPSCCSSVCTCVDVLQQCVYLC